MFNILIELKITLLDELDYGTIETVVSSFVHETPKSVTHNLVKKIENGRKPSGKKQYV